jgi:hypothetical protein
VRTASAGNKNGASSNKVLHLQQSPHVPAAPPAAAPAHSAAQGRWVEGNSEIPLPEKPLLPHLDSSYRSSSSSSSNDSNRDANLEILEGADAATNQQQPSKQDPEQQLSEQEQQQSQQQSQ